ncbi:MAG: hypothetical protein D6730_18655 [Bacteroidetes bacterium]|nr:MAG: hypothetical protein D6730_18655 [Bacteroidota bacterium]
MLNEVFLLRGAEDGLKIGFFGYKSREDKKDASGPLFVKYDCPHEEAVRGESFFRKVKKIPIIGHYSKQSHIDPYHALSPTYYFPAPVAGNGPHPGYLLW